MIANIDISTNKRTELIDITPRIRELVKKSKIEEGFCFVFAPHTTAGLTINENADPDVQRDILKSINNLIPFENAYQHSEGNSAAHIKASLIGSSKNIIIKDSELLLGRWQAIFFCEFDGPRKRNVIIKTFS